MIVSHHLEYCIQAWRQYRKKDIDKLQNTTKSNQNDSFVMKAALRCILNLILLLISFQINFAKIHYDMLARLCNF